MNCEIIQDLLPLYADDCCCEESRKAVEAHIATCEPCCSGLQIMHRVLPEQSAPKKPAEPTRVNDWKASIFQSVLLFLYFGLITIGVAQEAASPVGRMNGFWAMMLVVPATGFLISLANWYFLRLYKSRKTFSWSCCGITLAATVVALAWSCWHYGCTVIQVIPATLMALFRFSGILTLMFCILSICLSDWYAKLMGKD